MNPLKILFLLIVLLISASLSGETMYIHTQSGTLTFETSEIQEITFDVDSVDEYKDIFSKIPIQLMQNYPNPFNANNTETNIEFSLKNQGNTEVSIYNIKGQKVRSLVEENLNFGTHSFIWDGKNGNGVKVSSGIYFYKVKQNEQTKAKKMIVIR